MLDMKRREFMLLLGSTPAAWPLAVRAQQPAKLPTIGFLGTTTRSDASVDRSFCAAAARGI
jgi:putative ABC transport system substrate-binding protein